MTNHSQILMPFRTLGHDYELTPLQFRGEGVLQWEARWMHRYEARMSQSLKEVMVLEKETDARDIL